MEEKEEDPPPFWLQNTATLRRADRHRRRQNQASNLFLNTGVLVVLLLAAAVVFLAIVIPSVLSLARQVFNPSLVKSSWNSLNLILVLFAIVCGFLGRKDDDQTPVSSPMRRSETGKSADSSSSPRQWYEYHQDSRMAYSSFSNVDTMRRLRRNSSSYPDLRQEGPWMMNENRWRSYDDTHVDNYQVLRSDSRHSRSRSLGVLDEDYDIDVKNIEVDTFVSRAKEVTSPSPPPPSAARRSGHVRSREAADEKDQQVTKNIEMDNSVSHQTKVLKSESNPAMVNRPAPPSQPSYSRQPLSPPSPMSPTNYFWPPPSPPPPPPPPPPQRAHSSVAKNKHNNKRSNPTKRESRSKIETQTPSPPPQPGFLYQPMSPQPGFLYQPMSPPSPPSPINYFWPPPSPPPPPPPPPPPRRHPSNLAKKKDENTRNTPTKRESRLKVQTQIPSPPPQPRPILGNISEDTRDKKKGIVIRTLNRIPRRKRRQSRRSYENLTEFIEPPKVSIHRSKSNPEFPPSSPPPTPPPPPPPPPPSMFHNIFSKKGKTKKKVHSISTAVPPPPPPPPPLTRPLPKTRIKPPTTRRSAPPAKTDSFSSIDENTGNGSESPLIPTPPPPPPPPPPFKVPSWKYVMQGDYVKIESNNNSPRSGYSASEDEESSPSNQKNTMPSPLSCPSPDVNSKADDFIARFRAKLTLEKMNSIKRNQGTGPSPLGSDSSRP